MTRLIRTNIYLSKPQKKSLAVMARKQGISVAEYVRRIIDRQIELVRQ